MKSFVAAACLVFGSITMFAQQTSAPKPGPQYLISVSHGGRSLGQMKIELFPETAPRHVRNFDSLVSVKFYDGTAFHRVIPGFMIQGGDPNTKDKPRNMWGMGDPSQATVPAEFSTTRHVRGIISAARTADPNSATSQFFIMVGDAPHLDGKYSAYGRVIEGMEVADKIVAAPRDKRDNPLEKVEMIITRLDAAGTASREAKPKAEKAANAKKATKK